MRKEKYILSSIQVLPVPYGNAEHSLTQPAPSLQLKIKDIKWPFLQITKGGFETGETAALAAVAFIPLVFGNA